MLQLVFFRSSYECDDPQMETFYRFSPIGLFGYFKRDLFRYPWFLFRSLRLEQDLGGDRPLCYLELAKHVSSCELDPKGGDVEGRDLQNLVAVRARQIQSLSFDSQMMKVLRRLALKPMPLLETLSVPAIRPKRDKAEWELLSPVNTLNLIRNLTDKDEFRPFWKWNGTRLGVQFLSVTEGQSDWELFDTGGPRGNLSLNSPSLFHDLLRVVHVSGVILRSKFPPLRSLTHLLLENSRLQKSAFEFFVGKLRTLRIANTDLLDLPHVDQLRNLESFVLSHYEKDPDDCWYGPFDESQLPETKVQFHVSSFEMPCLRKVKITGLKFPNITFDSDLSIGELDLRWAEIPEWAYEDCDRGDYPETHKIPFKNLRGVPKVLLSDFYAVFDHISDLPHTTSMDQYSQQWILVRIRPGTDTKAFRHVKKIEAVEDGTDEGWELGDPLTNFWEEFEDEIELDSPDSVEGEEQK